MSLSSSGLSLVVSAKRSAPYAVQTSGYCRPPLRATMYLSARLMRFSASSLPISFGFASFGNSPQLIFAPAFASLLPSCALAAHPSSRSDEIRQTRRPVFRIFTCDSPARFAARPSDKRRFVRRYSLVRLESQAGRSEKRHVEVGGSRNCFNFNVELSTLHFRSPD